MANLRLEHIYKVYPNGAKAVNDFSMNIQNGEFIVFVGPSGCGKSTTLRMIAGLEDITAGELYIDSQIVNDVEPKDRDIAMVFQNYALYPHMSVYENMAFGLKLRHVPDDIIQEKVLWASEILGIKDYLDRKPKAMSGGQRQRVALGRAILRDPKVMLLDEPLSNLDAKLRTQMRTEIAKLHQKLKTTFIYVTHDQVEAMTLGDRVVVMKLGRIQQIDSPKNLYNYPANKFVAGFIGTPQMNFFPCTLKKEGDEVLVNLEDNNTTMHIDYNKLIKVLPGYFDGQKKIVFGIRCEHVTLAKDDDKNAVSVKVSHFEELGSESLIYGSLRLDDESITSEKSGNIVCKVKEIANLKSGDIIKVNFDMDHSYFFDAETEESIVPRLPVYNIFDAKVTSNTLTFLQTDIKLPKALEMADKENLTLTVPTDSLSLSKEEGQFKARIVNIEEIKDQKLLHLMLNNRIFFAVANKEDTYEINNEIFVSLDFTRISVGDENNTYIEPLRERDEFKALFLNYQTVMSKTSESKFETFRNEKIEAARQFMDAKILLENQRYDKEKLAADNTTPDMVSKAIEEFNTLKNNNNTKIAAIKKESKEQQNAEKKVFEEKQKAAVKENDRIFREKKEKEEAEYKAFKEHNKDRDALRRRSDEYHIFMDNFSADKNNAQNRIVSGLTMDYESKVATIRANSRREIDLLKKEIKEAKKDLERKKNPARYLDKEHNKNIALLTKEKNEAIERASLVFFFELANGYYEMASDIISNKLVQGLGTRVFSKEFLISMPHDGYTFDKDNKGFKATVKENLDYGNTYFVKLSFINRLGEEKDVYLKSEKPMEVGSEVSLNFDLNRCQIIETGMNIRLY